MSSENNTAVKVDLLSAGPQLRNDIVTGMGCKQIQLDDPAATDRFV